MMEFIFNFCKTFFCENITLSKNSVLELSFKQTSTNRPFIFGTDIVK